jgi:anti-sigma B factor antagonist
VTPYRDTVVAIVRNDRTKRAFGKKVAQMTIDDRTSGGVTIFDVRGRMTIEEVSDKALVGRVRARVQSGCNQIVLNLDGVPYVDTMGLCNIIEAYVTTKRQGGSLKLLHLARHVRELLVVTKLLSVFEAYDSEADAIASFERGAPA